MNLHAKILHLINNHTSLTSLSSGDICLQLVGGDLKFDLYG